ncbi:hypothetical protein [Streptomyces sp. NPDC058701]|uniref:hypothetical protein n=1 Tax=Streptomyces sp. NPDC058701 TaxID=3346608 RepID=UPI00364AF9C7
MPSWTAWSTWRRWRSTPKDGSLYEDPQPMRLRTYEDEHLMLWYQTIPHRSRVYLKRVNL